MMPLITEVLEGQPYQYYRLGTHVVRAIGICGGRPMPKQNMINGFSPLPSSDWQCDVTFLAA